MKKLVLLFMFFANTLAFGQLKTDAQMVKSFVNDVKGTTKSLNEIIQSYLCDVGQEKHQEKVDLLVFQLTELRKILRNAKIRIQPYSKVPSEEQNVQIKSAENVFRILANGKHACFVLLHENKIASFSTMQKGEGGERYFVKICD